MKRRLLNILLSMVMMGCVIVSTNMEKDIADLADIGVRVGGVEVESVYFEFSL